ncbi:MAG: hypothetical protein ABH872_06860 [Candidatus Omnitrophota bacterium]
MNFYLIGAEFKNIPEALRDSIFRNRQAICYFCRSINFNSAVLFTCNRVEIYGVCEDSFSADKQVDLLTAAYRRLFANGYVVRNNLSFVEAALNLACGLKSQILGEEEIIKQLKDWISQDGFSAAVKNFWQRVLPSAWRIRDSSGITESKYNLAALIQEDLNNKNNVNEKRKIAIIGTGKVARMFSDNKLSKEELFFVTRKNKKRARKLAEKVKGKTVLLDNITGLLSKMDAVVSATSSPHVILRKRHLEPALKQRRKTLYIYDLAVPHDVSSEIATLPGLSVITLNGLSKTIAEANRLLSIPAEKAKVLIGEEKFWLLGEIIKDAHKSRNPPQFVSL